MPDMNMAEALYYTFSTIAQALAAAMALLAAFAMYRLNAIEAECVAAAALLESITGGGTPLRQHYSISRWNDCLVAADRIIKSSGENAECLALRAHIPVLLASAARIRNSLWCSLGLTAVVMGGSVAVLTCVPAIGSYHIELLVLRLGIGSFVICLLAYVWLVTRAFRTR